MAPALDLGDAIEVLGVRDGVAGFAWAAFAAAARHAHDRHYRHRAGAAPPAPEIEYLEVVPDRATGSMPDRRAVAG